ncbi:MAG: aldo/keto reductase [Phycisphaeraceae bacterium]
MKYRPLGQTGLEVSVLSFGASSLGSVFRDVPEDEGVRTVHTALDLGVNLIDCSPYYGLTRAETVLGKALRSVPRDRYYLATKCGRYGATPADCDYSAARVVQSVEESLHRLGVEHLDILQVHDIEFADIGQIINETVPALHKLKQQGKTRFVGITGLPLRLFRQVIQQVEVDTVLSYCHYQLNDTGLEDLLPFLREHGVGVINASPLGMGLLSTRGTPDWHPAPAAVKHACARAAMACAACNMPIEKLAVQFACAHPQIPTTLVGTANPDNLRRNVRWIEEPIDLNLLAEVRQELVPVHNVTWTQGRPENN